MPRFLPRRRGRAVMFFVCAVLAGCAKNVTPTLVQPPPADMATLVIGEIAADDPQAKRLARFMRTAMIDRLVRVAAFAAIYDRPAGEIGADALVVDGEVTEAERGSDAWRFILGSGFGRPRLSASFAIVDSTGSTRVMFAASSDDDGPGGLAGHWAPLSMERVAADLGIEAADAIARWAHGESVTEPMAFWSQ